jgi:hypothetical protein
MTAMTLYDELIECMDRAAQAHPHSYVVVDTVSGDILAHGTDANKVARAARAKFKEGQMPAFVKQPSKSQTLIL